MTINNGIIAMSAVALAVAVVALLNGLNTEANGGHVDEAALVATVISGDNVGIETKYNAISGHVSLGVPSLPFRAYYYWTVPDDPKASCENPPSVAEADLHPIEWPPGSSDNADDTLNVCYYVAVPTDKTWVTVSGVTESGGVRRGTKSDTTYTFHGVEHSIYWLNQRGNFISTKSRTIDTFWVYES